METPTKPVAGAKPAFTTQSLVMMAIFAAILCISAYISIPIPVPGAPHITLLNFVILLIALLFPLQQSFFIILVWMLLGVVGLPVFIGGGAFEFACVFATVRPFVKIPIRVRKVGYKPVIGLFTEISHYFFYS